MKAIPYAIIGIGGYGARHLSAVLQLQEEGLLRLLAVADPFPGQNREAIEQLARRGVRHYIDWREMLGSERDLEAVSIPAPIPLHVPMATECFERKLHVVLEKPPAVLIQDMDRLIECADGNGVRCQVGFQNMMDPTAHKLKRYLLRGEIGKLQRITAFGAWKRIDSYYGRAEWAGKLRLGDVWVLDGPMNNPLCHYVHQALFFAGGDTTGTAAPARVRAELYRAHPIEGEDIACSRAVLDTGAILTCYLTTCAPRSDDPLVLIRGTGGTAEWRPGRCEITNDAGRRRERGAGPGAFDVIKNFVTALDTGAPLLSPLESTRSVILHNNACFQSSGRIHPLPEESIVRRPEPSKDGTADMATEAPGLVEWMEEGADKGALFSELDVPWARKTREVPCDFTGFDPGFLRD